MNGLFVLKGQLQQVYAKYSKFIDKAVQFILAFAAFYMIGRELGYMALLANPVIALGAAVICAFLPPVATVLCGAVMVLAHLYAVSLGYVAVGAIVFVLMFIFYGRFSPKKAIVILLTALAFVLKVPYIIPVAFGLLGTPIYVLPISFGVITHFMIDFVKENAAAVQSAEEASLLGDIGSFAKGIFQNKEMWVVIIAFIICLLVVYNIRRMGIAHAWKVAIAAGTGVNIVVIAAGGMALGVHASYGALIGGSVAAIVIGLVLEVIFFSVDYSRSETLQYEDDDYYYYVKAVPKIKVAAEDKTVKRISDRDDVNDETEVIDAEESRRKNIKEKREKNTKNTKKRPPKAKGSNLQGNTEQLLLTQSLERELNLKKKNK